MDMATVPAGDVVILSAEDDPECVLRPRLEANGADLNRIHFLTAVRDDNGRLQVVSIPRDVERIDAAVRKVNARLLIVDPPSAYLGREVDGFKDQAVRLALAPIQEMASQRRLSVIFNRHFNKGGGGRAIHKGGGSIAFAAAARTVLQVYPDPDDQDRRVLVVAKCNLARKAPSLMFRVASWERDPDVSCIEWEGETERSADDLLDAQGQTQAKKPETDYLREALAGGPVMASTIYTEGEARGFGSDALKRAKTKLGVRSYKEPGRLTGPWYWELPS
jgi:putative DNA primase/helicase